jgi:hypothetical protein
VTSGFATHLPLVPGGSSTAWPRATRGARARSVTVFARPSFLRAFL